jgi:hypothetical protein
VYLAVRNLEEFRSPNTGIRTWGPVSSRFA